LARSSSVSSSGGTASPTTVFTLDEWAVSITGSNGVRSATTSLQAALDPYYPAIYFPADQAKLIHESSISGSSATSGDNGQSTVWTIPCGTQFSLSCNIGGTLFSMDQSQLIQKNSDGSCSSYIRGWTDPTTQLYLFGSSFISSIYLIVKVANPSSGVPDQFGFATLAVKTSSKEPVGAIVGGTIGGVAVLVIIVVGIYFIIRRSNQQKEKMESFGYRPQSGSSYMAKDSDAPSSPPPISPNRAQFPT